MEGLPFYTMGEVAEHKSIETQIWATYNRGVYDVTDFIVKHPGGSIIMKGAGQPVDPFYAMYAVHKQPKNLSLLEQYRIGNITLEDAKEATSNIINPFVNEPVRNSEHIIRSLSPYNAEASPSKLGESFITPVDVFYVRNHLSVPEVDPIKYRLKVEGMGIRSANFSLDDIKSFTKYSVTSTMVCAGNRRQEMAKVKSLNGVQWNVGALGTASYSGPKLYDILTYLGLKVDEPGVQHVQFQGLDNDQTLIHYGCSIPIEKVMDPKGDVLLAYEMNGEPLTRDHGFPLRVISPGTGGARNCKWLESITISENESSSHWHQSAYKGFSPSTSLVTADFSKSPAVQVMPVTSAALFPLDGDTVKVDGGNIVISGYAYSGGGNKIIRVDITPDQGKTWYIGTPIEQADTKYPHHWTWTLWKAEIPVEYKNEVEIWIKAVDSSYNTQPESFENIWNFRGVVSNAYHKIKLNLS